MQTSNVMYVYIIDAIIVKSNGTTIEYAEFKVGFPLEPVVPACHPEKKFSRLLTEPNTSNVFLEVRSLSRTF